MKLEELVHKITDFDSDGHICRSEQAENIGSSDFLVVGIDDGDDPIVPPGYREFLDVSHAKQILEGIRQQSPDDPIVERFATYITNGA